ncbi:orotidine-5'-phosphate decarboxylase [bacterium DOLJORAL78_65_58]|nr:MAG: orotidine-5'-phosphate decarboxylase [bacterium DOLJORAL78_65_58]
MNREKLIAHLRALPAQRRIITALDVPGRQPALDLARRLGTGGGFVKVGLELFSAAGPEVVTQLRALAMTAAARALAEAEVPAGAVRPALLAVTVLTSLSEDELQETRPSDDTLDDAVVRLARLAWDCGCDGVVCSAADLPRLRAALGPDILTVTPGIRMPGGSTDDQHRITTPRMAVESGADFLVVGRPITKADDPAAALTAIAHHMENGG